MADVCTRQLGYVKFCENQRYIYHESVITFQKYGRFVAPAASDWSLYEAAFPLSIVFLMQGVSASLVVKQY